MAMPCANRLSKRKKEDRKCETLVDPVQAPVIKQMFEKVAYDRWSGRKIYNWLKFDLNFRTSYGKKHLSLGNIYKILDNTFYYGVFEYPKNSGNWYTGKHNPIISKDLFDLVQKQVKSNILRVENKEFAFTKLMTCGLCGSGISADEKFKKLKNGESNRHVYYGCTKAKDKNCKCGYLNEENLIIQLQGLVDHININEIAMKDRIKEEVERIKGFQKAMFNINEKIDVKEIDMQNYIKHILRTGKESEKREIIGCFKSKIILKNKRVSLE